MNYSNYNQLKSLQENPQLSTKISRKRQRLAMNGLISFSCWLLIVSKACFSRQKMKFYSLLNVYREQQKSIGIFCNKRYFAVS